MKKLIICTLLTILLLPVCLIEIGYASEEQSYFIIKTNQRSTYQTIKETPTSINKFLKKAKWREYEFVPSPTDYFIQVNALNGVTTYNVQPYDWIIYDEKDKKAISDIPLSVRKQLYEQYELLKSAHYGEKLPWSEVNNTIPKYKKFSVLDLDTGLQFNVQRRAGSKHADVQPLTKEDTAIMREIYNGKWSWNRRAIIVETDSNKIAASMHGMPHGRGALSNNFPGHFCIHFFESTTHASKKEDFAHSVMIRKAAGEWLKDSKQLTPSEIIEAFITSVNQHDEFVLASIIDSYERSALQSHLQELKSIEHLKRLSPLKDPIETSSLHLTIPVKVHVHKEETSVKTIQFTFYRETILDSWKLDFEKTFTQL